MFTTPSPFWSTKRPRASTRSGVVVPKEATAAIKVVVVAATVKEVLAGKHMESVLKSTREKAANLLLGEKGGATGGEAPTTSTGCSGIT